MTSYSALMAADVAAASQQFGEPKGPATIGELWNSQWARQGLDTTSGVAEPLMEANTQLRDALVRETGQSFDAMAEAVTGRKRGGLNFDEREKAAVLSAYAGGLARDVQTRLPHLDPMEAARRKAAEIERQAADVSSRTSGLSAFAVSFAAGAARQLTDPLALTATVATLPFGGAAGMTALRFAGREFGANAAAQAIQEPGIQSGRAQLQLENGVGDALQNILFAGAVGAALHPIIYLRAGARALAERAATKAAPAADLPLSPRDLEAAAMQAETHAFLDRHAASPADLAVMPERLQAASDGLESGGRRGFEQLPEAAPQALAVSPHRVIDASGRAIDVQPVVVEASQLRASSDAGFDAALQPRDRSRAASEQQIREIASRLDPERLGFSAEADRGAPIVGPDAMVESGNGRIMAIRQAYADNGPAAQSYRDWIAAQGVDVSGFKEPVLVRQRLTELTAAERQEFVIAANKAATLAFSASERALADARKLNAETLALIRNPADLGAAANRDFVRSFIRSLPQAEHGAMATAEGALSSEGLMRVRHAVSAAAYGDAPVLARIAEATHDEVKSISNALVAAAPKWARLRADIEAGHVRGDMDVTRQLMEAVDKTAHLRATGGKLPDFLAQVDAFDPLHPLTEDFMRMFYDAKGLRAASAERISDALTFYADEAAKVTAAPGLDLGLPALGNRDIIQSALNRGKPDANQTDFFAAGTARDGARPDTPGREVSGSGAGDARAGAAGGSDGAAGAQRQAGGQATAGAGADAAANAGRLNAARAAIARHGDNLIIGEDAAGRPVTAAETLQRIEHERTASAELSECLARGGLA